MCCRHRTASRYFLQDHLRYYHNLHLYPFKMNDSTSLSVSEAGMP